MPRHPHTLGQFLRARRDRLQPEDFGLPGGHRRRAPGLRREEVATLCGISPTWYTWIEQGRTSAISVETLGALARGLRLSQAERSYLFALASRADPSPPSPEQADPHRLADLLAAINTPAYVLDRHWDAIGWNDPAAELFEDWLGRTHQGGRSLLRYVFLHPRAPLFIIDWPERARRLVAEYRADTAAWHDDPVRRTLVEELSWESAPFKAAWGLQDVLAREGGLRRFQHPRRGLCLYEQFTLRVAQRPELKLTVLVPQDGTSPLRGSDPPQGC
jgi:transcriptional regulator with XRE-family HTH domain